MSRPDLPTSDRLPPVLAAVRCPPSDRRRGLSPDRRVAGDTSTCTRYPVADPTKPFDVLALIQEVLDEEAQARHHVRVAS